MPCLEGIVLWLLTADDKVRMKIVVIAVSESSVNVFVRE